MEISPNKDEILGKRKRYQENENYELEAKEEADLSDQGKCFSQTGSNYVYGSESSKKCCSNLTQDEEKNFETTKQEFLNSEEFLIENLLRDALVIIRKKIKVENECVENAHREIKESFKVFGFTKVDFNDSANLIAYFTFYSLFNAELSRNRFLYAFENCKQLRKTVKKQHLNIISLGGGPGTDMIGFCSVLQDFLTQIQYSFNSINITVVDMWKRWASFYNVIEFLTREGDYGNVSTFFQNNVVFSSFMMVDLLSAEQPCKYVYDLKAADIVLLVRVLDSFNFKETNPDDIMEKIIAGMKSESLLLVIDSVKRGHYDTDKVTEVYKSNLKEFEMQVSAEKLCYLNTPKSSKANILILQKK